MHERVSGGKWKFWGKRGVQTKKEKKNGQHRLIAREERNTSNEEKKINNERNRLTSVELEETKNLKGKIKSHTPRVKSVKRPYRAVLHSDAAGEKGGVPFFKRTWA